MPGLWKFGGLTPIVVTQRAIKKLGEDELSTRSAALSYYFILALFPLLLFLVPLIGIFASPGSELRETILSALGRRRARLQDWCTAWLVRRPNPAAT